jgi:hypothetical protein
MWKSFYYQQLKKNPPQIVFEFGNHRLVFILIEEKRYAAELDGNRQPIRSKSVERRDYVEGIEVTENEGETANIDNVVRCLELGAKPTVWANGIRLSALDQWGHSRKIIDVEIVVSEKGTIEIRENIDDQDDGYY